LHDLEQRFNGADVEEFAALAVTAQDPRDKKAAKAARRRLKDEHGNQPPTRLRPRLAVYQGYSRPKVGGDEPDAMGTVFEPHLVVLRLERLDGPYRHLDLACTLQVTSRWRDALLSQSNDLSEAARSVLSGHDAERRPLESPHLAFLPFAFVGHQQADGHLLGLAAVLPRNLAQPVRRDVLRALARVRELKLGRLGCWRLEAVTESRPPVGLRASTWTAQPSGATEWSTVTPFVLDRHPKTRDPAAYRHEVAEVIADACTRIGLPAPSHVVVTPVSAHLGAPAGHDYPRLHRKDGSQRRHTHAILVFDRPVRGPILIGAGRYRGYGVCRALRSADQ
jgi:CRISPR-associated protein Csb2